MNIDDLGIIESHSVKMMFYPKAWQNPTIYNITWKSYDFPPTPKNIPNSPGVYAFVVEPNLFSLTPASGLFYIGKATNLYSRIGSYKGELKKDFLKSKRPHIWKMLHRWNGHLKYYFSTTNDVEEAERMETLMLNALRPPFNKQYEAETSTIMRAF